MPATVTATLLGTYKSIARATGASNANTTTSLDVITVVHLLGASPDTVNVVLRSVSVSPSSSVVMLAPRTWNASQVVLDLPAAPGATAWSGLFDVICAVEHSIIK